MLECDLLSFFLSKICMWILPIEGKEDKRLVDTNTLSEENCFLTACRSLPAAQCWLEGGKAASLH